MVQNSLLSWEDYLIIVGSSKVIDAGTSDMKFIYTQDILYMDVRTDKWYIASLKEPSKSFLSCHILRGKKRGWEL